MALAVMLGRCLGQRPANLRTPPWSAHDGPAVALRQAKTETEVWVPALPELRWLLETTPRVAVQIVVRRGYKAPISGTSLERVQESVQRGWQLSH